MQEVLETPPVEPWPDNDPEPDLPELAEPAQESGQPAQEPGHPALPEAPASVNVRITIGGREVQWTLRDTSEDRLAERLMAPLARYPVPQAPAPAQPQTPAQPLSPQQHNAAAMHRPVEGFCPVHNCQMHLNTGKDGRQWWSHRLPEGGFCKGK